jgi:hypothetical protein
VISSDLTAITLKDLNDLLKALNTALDKENQLSLSGKKQDIVDRLTEYFLSELEKKDQTSIKGAVAIVNRVARKKQVFSLKKKTLFLTFITIID